jgi:hypothetical protein
MRAAVLLAVSILFAVAPAAVVAEPTLQGYVSNVDRLTRDILKDEIQLEQFSLRYRLETGRANRFKSWRYFAFQEAALGLFEANCISLVSYRGENLNNPEELKRGPAACATALPMLIGFAVGGTGDAIELGLNTVHSWQRGRTGFSQNESRAHVAAMLRGIDAKLAERRKIIDAEPPEDAETAELQKLEGRLLEDFRDLSVAEFQRYHIGASRGLAMENTFYLLDIGKASTGCVWTGLDLYLIRHGRGRIDTASGIVDIINAASVVIDPVAAKLAGSIAENIDRRKLRASGLPSPDFSEDKLKADYKILRQFAAAHATSDKADVMALLARMDHYEANTGYYTEEIRHSASELQEIRRSLLEHLGWGMFVGGSKMPLGILSVISGARFPYRDRINNSYYFAGGLAYMPAVTISIVDSWRRQIQGEIAFQRLRREHKLPGQLINGRLAELHNFSQKL